MTTENTETEERNSADIINESIDFINEIDTKEQNVYKMAESINKTIQEINTVIDWVTHSIIEPRQQQNQTDESNENPSHLKEYLLFYIVTFLTVGSAFGFFAYSSIKPHMDWSSIIKLAMVLSSAILVGVIKDTLWKMIQKKTKEYETVKTRNKALETALASQSIHTTKTNIKLDRLVRYIQDNYPDANIEDILYTIDVKVPKKLSRLQSVQEIAEQIAEEQKEKEKNLTSTIKL